MENSNPTSNCNNRPSFDSATFNPNTSSNAQDRVNSLIFPENYGYKTLFERFCKIPEEAKKPFAGKLLFNQKINIDSDIHFNYGTQEIQLLNSSGEIDSFVYDNELMLLTEKTLKMLIEEKKQEKLPYFLAISENLYSKSPMVYDGVEFLKNYCFQENTKNLLAKTTIQTFTFYRSSKIKDIFKFFCNEKTLRKNRDWAGKFILATDNTWMGHNDSVTGKNSFFVANYYEKKAISHVKDMDKQRKKFQKAILWLNRAGMKGNPDAMWNLGSWYMPGQNKGPFSNKSLLVTLLCFKEAVDNMMSPDHPSFKKSREVYLKLLDLVKTQFPEMPDQFKQLLFLKGEL